MAQKKKFKAKHFGPFRTYPGLKRDFAILVGLVLLLLVIKAAGG